MRNLFQYVTSACHNPKIYIPPKITPLQIIIKKNPQKNPPKLLTCFQSLPAEWASCLAWRRGCSLIQTWFDGEKLSGESHSPLAAGVEADRSEPVQPGGVAVMQEFQQLVLSRVAADVAAGGVALVDVDVSPPAGGLMPYREVDVRGSLNGRLSYVMLTSENVHEVGPLVYGSLFAVHTALA